MEIRVFQQFDRNAVVELWGRCQLTRPWNDPHRDIDRKLALQPELFLVGTIDARIVATAMAGYDGHRGWIYYLAVDPACRGRGYARSLITTVSERLRVLGCPKVELMIRSDNLDAVEFYRRMGFTQQDVVVYALRLIDDTSPK